MSKILLGEPILLKYITLKSDIILNYILVLGLF